MPRGERSSLHLRAGELERFGVREDALEHALELAHFDFAEPTQEIVGDANRGGQRLGIDLAALGSELELDRAPLLGAARAAHQAALLEGLDLAGHRTAAVRRCQTQA